MQCFRWFGNARLATGFTPTGNAATHLLAVGREPSGRSCCFQAETGRLAPFRFLPQCQALFSDSPQALRSITVLFQVLAAFLGVLGFFQTLFHLGARGPVKHCADDRDDHFDHFKNQRDQRSRCIGRFGGN